MSSGHQVGSKIGAPKPSARPGADPQSLESISTADTVMESAGGLRALIGCRERCHTASAASRGRSAVIPALAQASFVYAVELRSGFGHLPLNYSLQANAKTQGGCALIPTVTPQFRHISQTVQAAVASGEPAISVDAKKTRTGRGFQELSAASFAPQGPPGRGTHARLQRQARSGNAIPYGDPTTSPDDEGWVIGRDRQRHRPVRGRLDPAAGGSSSARDRYPERDDA